MTTNTITRQDMAIAQAGQVQDTPGLHLLTDLSAPSVSIDLQSRQFHV